MTALLGHRPRTKTAMQIIAELDSLYELGWRGGIFFVNDNLIGNKRCLETELLPALVEWRKDKKVGLFSTEVSINLADDESLMHLMTQAGFGAVFVGIETPDESGLAECSKKQNMSRDLVESVKRLQRAGLQVQGGFIVGFDSDTPSIFQRQIDFIQESGIVTAMVGLLQAPPGTHLHARLKQAGRLLEQMSGDNVDGTTNNEYRPHHGLGHAEQGLSADIAAHLLASTLLPACQDLLGRIQAAQAGGPLGPCVPLGDDPGVHSFYLSPRHQGTGANPLLEAPMVDTVSPSHAGATGCHPGHLRLSFSHDL